MNSFLGRRSSKCKGPEVGRSMVCLRNRKKEQLSPSEPGEVRQTRLGEHLEETSCPLEEREPISNYMIM